MIGAGTVDEEDLLQAVILGHLLCKLTLDVTRLVSGLLDALPFLLQCCCE